ncbi:M42 family metallopeptidase [Mariniblastus fucicola]|uniref:Aminopeptidase YsdC n=1 Tax=Mariniblastus fucicola TaxID=980251 RepID=A0A5B9PB41_9BACT|nr:M42 family metallopeptidase [Mariniblastus fucicola]QEG22729.1 Putative aminopeptidase YsdC [Mariniblastus fucicola]
MNEQSFEFFETLLNTPGVSGYEEPVQSAVREYAGGFADSIETDLHGNLILCKNPDADVRLMLAGHCDQIGLIVSYIDEFGFIYTQTVGGWDPQQLIGQRMTIWTKNGPVEGVIARKAIHLLDDAERKKVVKTKELWIDIGATDREQAESIVDIGDSVTLELGMTRLQNNLVTSPATDNRTGVWVAVEAMRIAAEAGVKIGVYAVSTVQEEIGLRGARTAAFSIDPHVGVAIDVTHATDCPKVDKNQLGDIKLGGGPVVVRGPNVNQKVNARLHELAAAKDELSVQASALGRAAPNDSNAIQVNRGGVATGLIGIPNRYMHSAVEVISLDDIANAAILLADFACSIKSADEFVPG